MTQPLIAGNWKMNGDPEMAEAFAGELRRRVEQAGGARPELLVCPPFPLLPGLAAALAGSGVALGAQDCHFEASGAHTGDVSAELLAALGCAYVILGHSERRADHGESDALVKAKAEAAAAAGLMPIVCVGESEAERDAGRAVEVVLGQLKGSRPEAAGKLVVAYEPVWAIGTGRTPSSADIAEMHAALRKAAGEGVRLLYGGSMKPANAAEILAIDGVNGGLIGGASLKPEDFWAIAEAAA
jgi:triosephosphate isomerase